MSDFDEKFTQICGLWPTKKGTGFTGKLKLEGMDEIRIFMWENKSDNSRAPKWKIYIAVDDSQPKEPQATSEKDEVPF